MKKKGHYGIDLLKRLGSVFRAYDDRAATVSQTTPTMHEAVKEIINSARKIEAGLGHIDEAHFDREELKYEFARITQIAISLPEIFEGDGSFWGYILDMVNLETFRGGAEYCDIERLQNFVWVLNETIALKLEKKQAGEKDDLP